MVQPWFELESDPGLFTLLVEDFGIEGVQVEEIYDLDTVSDMGSEPLGFIFLFRWIEDRRRRRKLLNENHLFVKDKTILEDMFFAHQVIPNSCATHALLSILLNSEDKSVKLSKQLLALKTTTKGMSPEQKGEAIGSIPKIAEAHNSHASPHLRLHKENKSNVPGASQAGEAYHYVSYLPINGHLYEMDGLKPWPLDHGQYADDWTQKFSQIITERLGGGDIMFNLMAVVPDRRVKYRASLESLKTNWETLSGELQLIIETWKQAIPNPSMLKLPTNNALTVQTWTELIREEHNYILPQSNAPDSPPKSPIKAKSAGNSISNKVEEIINAISDLSASCTNQVVVSQEDDSKACIPLQETCEFDPCKPTHVKITSNASLTITSFTVQELLEMLADLKSHIADAEQLLEEQEDLRGKYKIDVCRRTHNYYPFITTFLRMLSEQGLLTDMVNGLNQPKKKLTSSGFVPNAVQSASVSNLSSRAKKHMLMDNKMKCKAKNNKKYKY